MLRLEILGWAGLDRVALCTSVLAKANESDLDSDGIWSTDCEEESSFYLTKDLYLLDARLYACPRMICQPAFHV